MLKIKTPHRRPLRHMCNMVGLFVLAVAVTVWLQLGASFVAVTGGFPLLGAAGACLTAGVISLVAGIIVTATVRRCFNLIQTGRLIQYAGFCLSSWLGLKLTALMFSAIALTHAALAGCIVFAIAFGLATALGEVPVRGRTWLPMAKKTK